MDSTTRELASIVLTLRRDLTVTVRPSRDAAVTVIEDETAGRFFRIGPAEATFVSLLDGRRPFADVFAQAAAISGEDALTEQQAAGLCRWLVESGLAWTEASRAVDRLSRSERLADRRRQAGRWNILFWKTPLGCPDRLFAGLAAVFGWLLAGPMLAVGAGLVAFAAVLAATSHRHTLGGHAFGTDDAIWIGAIWLGLRLVHEAAHGIAARRLGCPVREYGLTWILFVPLPYVDVTSAWRLDRRRDRMLISAAGMMAELLVAAAAAIVWAVTPPSPLHEHAGHLMLAGSVVTLLFNANPLMRFDGYHLITDALDLPNLAGHGQQMLRSLGRRWGLGLGDRLPRWPDGRHRLVFVYAVAALGWRIVLCVSLALAAEMMWRGAGVVVAAAAILLWWVVPAGRLLRLVAVGSETEQPSRLRFAGVALAAASLVAIVAALPWSPSRSAASTRATSSGDPAPIVSSVWPGRRYRPS